MIGIPALCPLLLNAGFFRLCGIMFSFPFPQSLVPFGVRIGLALALSLGRLGGEQPVMIENPWLVACFEVIFGILIGIPCLLVYHGVRAWADLFESLRGHQMGLMIDPLSGTEEPPFAILCGHLMLCLLSIFGLLPCVVLLSQNLFVRYPPHLVTIATLGEFAQAGMQVFQIFLSSIFSTLLPFALLIVIVEVAVGIIGKVARGVSLSSEAYVLRMVLLSTLLVWHGEHIFIGFLELLTTTLPAL